MAHLKGASDNQLPALLREWFGDRAGLPGTHFQVHFTCDAGRWSAAPVQVAQANKTTPPAQIHGVSGFPPGMVHERTDSLERTDSRERTDSLERTGSHADSLWVKVITLAAAATGFSDSQEPEDLGWVLQPHAPAGTKLCVAQVRGHSMEPTTPDGAWCLFRNRVVGSRNGRVLLVQHRSISDPEHGGKYTVKRYRSTKVADGDSWQHASITLHSDNKQF